jgi:putative sterol carrier protein
MAESYKAFTQEWMDAWKKIINGSQEYREIAKEWEGSVSITVNADPSKNVPEPVYMFTDYWHGDALDFLICDAAKAQTAKFIMSGDYSRWKQVAKKELDATKALMQGKLKLKGDLTYVVRNVKTINKVVDLLTEINTIFPDEV